MSRPFASARLGKQGPMVPRLGYGCMGLSAFYGAPKSDEYRMAVLDSVYAQGGRLWDTADVYADGEDLLAKWFEQNPEKRKDIILATKFGFRFDNEGNMTLDTSPEYVRQACLKSLSRLRAPCIDLYYAHRLDGKTPIEKTMEALKALQQEGKIKYIGLSECSSETLRRASKVHCVDAVQVEYSLFSLDIESEKIGLLKTCRELGVAIVAYSPIGRGMLSGKIRNPELLEDEDSRKVTEENLAHNLKLVDAVTAIADKEKITPSQLALAWLLEQGDDVFPIPGTTNLSRVEENFNALNMRLPVETIQELRKLSEVTGVLGHRYPESFASALFADTPDL